MHTFGRESADGSEKPTARGKKGRSQEPPLLQGHSWGLLAPLPSTEVLPRTIWASHLLSALVSSRVFLLEEKNILLAGQEGKQQQWPPLTDGGTAACCPEPHCPYWTWTRTESSLCFGCASARGAAWPHGALACIFSRQLVQNITSRLSRLMQKSVKSLSSRSANFSSPVALERHVLVSMVL